MQGFFFDLLLVIYPETRWYNTGMVEKSSFRNQQQWCEYCGGQKRKHTSFWLDGLMQICTSILPNRFLPPSVYTLVASLLDTVLLQLGLVKEVSSFDRFNVPIRSVCFTDEAKRVGIIVTALRGPAGFINQFRMRVAGSVFSFEGLPTGFPKGEPNNTLDIDDKAVVKKALKSFGFPILPSKSFWFFQKKQAVRYARQIGYPVVVKPRFGSYSRHVFTDIGNDPQLIQAIDSNKDFGPAFLVERFLPHSFVHRATVVDSTQVFCLKRAAAFVTGDGMHTISELVEIKNRDPNRGETDEEAYTLFKIPLDTNADAYLAQQGFTRNSVPKNYVRVGIQKDPFIRLGADGVEVTSMLHPDTVQLFQNVAKQFNLRLVGLDFLCQDISKSWKEQPCAILELNSLPCIEVHHYPSEGIPQNVGLAIVNMVKKYYVS